MTTKPRIRREFSLLYRQMAWFCRGSGYLGVGFSPSDAYWLWKYNRNQRQAIAQNETPA